MLSVKRLISIYPQTKLVDAWKLNPLQKALGVENWKFKAPQKKNNVEGLKFNPLLKKFFRCVGLFLYCRVLNFERNSPVAVYMCLQSRAVVVSGSSSELVYNTTYMLVCPN